MKILFLQMKRYSEFARLCFRSERVFVMGGDPTKNCNFHRGKVGLLCCKNSSMMSYYEMLKIFRAARANLFRIRSEFLKKKHDKSMIYSKNFPRCARQFVKNLLRKIKAY